MKVLSVVGARPNFMKIAPISHALKQEKDIKHIIVHTGQHYDYAMSEAFFRQLGIPKPDINLEIGSASQAIQTGQIMLAFEKVLLKHKPDVVIVVGDVNSTMACSLVAVKLRIPVAHVEAGLRSRDRDMPEEINRLVTDSIADIQFTTSLDANKNLIKEGIPKERIFFVGNVMIDTLLRNLKKAEKSKALKSLLLKKKEFALVTLHRPSNVDSKRSLMKIVQALRKIQNKMQVIFPVHPRTKRNLYRYITKTQWAKMKNVCLLDPLPYFDFLQLMTNAKIVLTDSGGVQEETTVLGIPCLTLRKNTERPVTIKEGTNCLVGLNVSKILKETDKVIRGKLKKSRIPKYWDGKASLRIVKILKKLHKQKGLIRP